MANVYKSQLNLRYKFSTNQLIQILGLKHSEAIKELECLLERPFIFGKNRLFQHQEYCAFCQEQITSPSQVELAIFWSDDTHAVFHSHCADDLEMAVYPLPPHTRDVSLFKKSGIPEFPLVYSIGGLPLDFIPVDIFTNGKQKSYSIIWQWLIYVMFSPYYIDNFSSRVWFLMRLLLLYAEGDQAIDMILKRMPTFYVEKIINE